MFYATGRARYQLMHLAAILLLAAFPVETMNLFPVSLEILLSGQ